MSEIKEILENIARNMKIKKLCFVSECEGFYIYFNSEINFKINSSQKMTIWKDTKKEKQKDEINLYVKRINTQVEIFEFSEFNILEASKELTEVL